MEVFNSVQVRDEAVMQVKADPGKTAADIGAGTGFITEGLLNAGCNVIAVDSSPEMISVLKERFGHMQDVQVVFSGYSPLKLNDNCTDYVFSYMQLSVSENPAVFISELKRIVKPGGKIAVTDLLFHKHNSVTEKYGFMHHGFTLPDLYDWFVQAGIKNISIETAGTVELPGDIKLDIFLAYGEK
ncbi:MAG TPA: class I SAM-dependent methyltransferase [Spirochaetota bacterium]|nr:class I SAM-dependent methyltransferase [Spirochaetota bacterium]